MWLYTTLGFFSCVKDRQSDLIIIRARVKEDIENLKRLTPHLGAIIETPNRDYPFRATIKRFFFDTLLSEIALSVDYPNFKDEVKKKQGKDRAGLYTRIWATTISLEKNRQDRFLKKTENLINQMGKARRII